MSDKYTMNLQGKEYRLVAGRVMDFRKKNPMGQILTDLLFAENDRYIVKATVIIDGTVISTGHGEVSKSQVKGQVTPLEKAETKAIGRALGVAGYGTDDIWDDADNDGMLADSPIPPSPNKQTPQAQPSTQAPKHPALSMNTHMQTIKDNPALQAFVKDLFVYAGIDDNGKKLLAEQKAGALSELNADVGLFLQWLAYAYDGGQQVLVDFATSKGVK